MNAFILCWRCVQELQRSINKLSVRLMPWQPSVNTADAVKVEDMMRLVDTLLENVSADDQQVGLYFDAQQLVEASRGVSVGPEVFTRCCCLLR